MFKSLRRFSLLVVACFGLIAVPVGSSEAETVTRDPLAMEQDFVARVNELRASQGLKPYTVDPEIRSVAMAWTEKMATADAISHNPDLGKQVNASWTKLGENVGYGGDVESVENAFEASPGHRKNLLDPTFTMISITVVVKGPALYVTQQFRQPETSTAKSSAAGPVPAELAFAAPSKVANVKAARFSRSAGPKLPTAHQRAHSRHRPVTAGPAYPILTPTGSSSSASILALGRPYTFRGYRE